MSLKTKKKSRIANKDAPLPKVRAGLEDATKYKTDVERIAEGRTAVDRKAIKLKIDLAKSKRNVTRYTDKLAKLKKADALSSELVLPTNVKESIEAEENPTEVIFKPNPGPQTEFLSADEDEVFYGGARGGGKTYSLIVDPLPFCINGNFRGLMLRRTMPELRQIIGETKKIYPRVFKGAKFKTRENTWHFPSGATIEFGYAERLEDAERYRGQSYTWIGLDELPQHPSIEIYDMLKSSNRSADPSLKTYMRSTGNPGSIGSQWVKQKFIDPVAPNTTFFEHSDLIDPKTKQKKVVTRSLRYIPASVWDNPYLTMDDSYISALASLPKAKQEQMLYGNWDIIEDSAFPEFDKNMHVIEPFEIPNTWTRFRAADWGYASPFCCLWFAVDYDENVYVYREYYGTKVIADQWAKNIAKLERRERILYGKLDGSTDQSRGDRGDSIFAVINKELRNAGSIPFGFADRSPGSRAAGRQEVHKRLLLRKTGEVSDDGVYIERPSLFIFNTCRNLIRTLPSLPIDPSDAEKVAKKGAEDHAYDALQYGLRSRPISPLQIVDINQFRERNQFKAADDVFGY